MSSFLKKLFIFLTFIALLAAVGAASALYWLVVVNPGPEIQLSYIESILGRESPVFYRDGREKLGVLFQEAHREYLPYSQIPQSFVNAIIAAEDAGFFDHYGIDLSGIARATVANIKAGRITQGGSTITQQTAKNLFRRESRTFQSKLKELLYALRLEYHYPKEKILEFYVNQFFVSGNGHGLGVAARYYFDKQAGELTLLENAFIAGSVKRPNYYNPFIKSTEEASEKARARAADRAGYVLRNMLRLGFISDAQYKDAAAQKIEFNRGLMSFSLNSAMDLVRDGLSSPEITGALEDHGISNASTSGIRIFTTLDKDLQKTALASLRAELSRLDIQLRGYNREEVQQEYGRLEYAGDDLAEKGNFLFGRIENIDRDYSRGASIKVDLGRKHPAGIIDMAGLERALPALARFTRHRWSSVEPGDAGLLLGQMQPGDKVYVQVREVPGDGPLLLDLERFPQLQGAALVMQEGVIRAMAGGMENRYFNRAIDARRLMGSTFKPFLFAAAMQLGWSPTDMLNNVRDVFVYQDKPYFPRPDHLSPNNKVSMSWAGVNSENLAAVWLLYRLADRLTPPRLREVAAYLGLAPGADAMSGGQEYFRQLIRDRYGIVVDRDVILQAAYDSAVRNLETDFLFEGLGAEYQKLKELPYGLHFDRFAAELTLRLGDEEGADELSGAENKELGLRLGILGRSYLGLQPSLNALRQNRLYFEAENAPPAALDPLALFDHVSGNLRPVGFFWEDENGKVGFSLGRTGEDRTLLTEQDIHSRLSGLETDRRDEFWDSIEVEGLAGMHVLRQLDKQMTRERERLFAEKPYSTEVLSEVRDYRVLVGLQYLIRLGREMGIEAELEPVLSFPLGSNVISLLDAVRMYETLVTGERFKPSPETGADEYYDESTGNGLAVIDRIETVDGRVIYSRQQQRRRIVDPASSAAVADILHNTVRHGTGRYAGNVVRLQSNNPERQRLLDSLNLPVPLLGKTGTANDFRNSAFIGFVPVRAADESFMQLKGGYTVGVYVGFDDNRPMKKGSTHITGAGGALPAWSSLAMALVNADNAADGYDAADLSFNGLPLQYEDTGQVFVPVSKGKGGAVVEGMGAMRAAAAPAGPSILAHGRVDAAGNFEPDRFFRPFWKNREGGHE